MGVTTTVSDCLLFNKCPYAWWVRTVKKRKEWPSSTGALAIGTKIHQDLATYFKGGDENAVPEYFLDKAAGLRNVKRSLVFKEVEVPHSCKVEQHTFYFRPDGVVSHVYTPSITGLFQIKSVSANKQHYAEYVRISQHECLYSYGLGLANAPTYTLIIRKSTPKRPPLLDLRMVTRSMNDVQRGVNWCYRIACQMEAMLDEVQEDEEKAGCWQSPNSCIDWITGSECPYKKHCHNNVSLDSAGFTTVEDRYEDLVSGESGESEED